MKYRSCLYTCVTEHPDSIFTSSTRISVAVGTVCIETELNIAGFYRIHFERNYNYRIGVFRLCGSVLPRNPYVCVVFEQSNDM